MLGTVYTLSHPETGEVRYVGITTAELNTRLIQHISVAKRSERHTHKDCWVRSLLDKGLKPTIEVIEEVTVDALNDREVEYIAKFKSDGARLTNSTSGGQANFTVSEETKAKMSEASKGKKKSEDHRKNIGLASSLRRHTEETKAKMSVIATGRPRTEETRKKIAETRLAKGIGKGENNSKSILKEYQVLEIYDKIKLGYTDKELASKYGISKSGVSGIRHGHNWKHLFEKYYKSNANF